jgi:hypothetical protein
VEKESGDFSKIISQKNRKCRERYGDIKGNLVQGSQFCSNSPVCTFTTECWNGRKTSGKTMVYQWIGFLGKIYWKPWCFSHEQRGATPDFLQPSRGYKLK